VNILITGASKGLGEVYAKHIGRTGDTLYLVSRSKPSTLDLQDDVQRIWLEADLTAAKIHEKIVSQVPELDVLIHNAATWESTAFSRNYQFEAVLETETRQIVELNLIAPILLTQAFLPMMKYSNNPRIIFIGSTNGLENSAMQEVAYNATKFGLRGIAHALRETLRQDNIGVTVINPGSIGWEGSLSTDFLIPPIDIVNLTRTILEMSRQTVVKEVDMPAMQDNPV
jgi:short-subunit dehydrogenase